MKSLRIFAIFTVIALVAVGVFTFAQGQRSAGAQEQENEVLDEAFVTVRDLRVTIGATGALAPDRQVQLLFSLPGIVREVLVSEGQRVRAGDVIATVEADALEAAVRDAELLRDIRAIALNALLTPPRPEDIAAAQAALDAAQAQFNATFSTTSEQASEIARLQAEIARNALWQAQIQRDLAVNPPPITITVPSNGAPVPPQQVTVDQPGADPEQFEPGLQQAEFGVQIADARAASAADSGPDQGAVASANAAVVAAQTALDRLVNGPTELDLQMAQLELTQAEAGIALAQANLRNAQLIAPFDGVIADLNLTVGELPPTQGAAVLLIDDGSFYIDLPVDESDIARLSVGQPVEIRLDALPDQPLSGQVSRTPLTPAPSLPGQNVVTYIVRVTLDPTDAPIRAAMTATATVIVDSLSEVLVLPNRFIRIDRSSGSAFVTIENADGAFEEVPVVLGVRNETQSEIVSGLTEGTRAVLLSQALFDPVAANGPPQ